MSETGHEPHIPLRFLQGDFLEAAAHSRDWRRARVCYIKVPIFKTPVVRLRPFDWQGWQLLTSAESGGVGAGGSHSELSGKGLCEQSQQIGKTVATILTTISDRNH